MVYQISKVCPALMYNQHTHMVYGELHICPYQVLDQNSNDEIALFLNKASLDMICAPSVGEEQAAKFDKVYRLACLRRLASHCLAQCSTCVAQGVRGMRLDVIPAFLRFITGSLFRVP